MWDELMKHIGETLTESLINALCDPRLARYPYSELYKFYSKQHPKEV
jgi:hypothetical protein